MARKTHCICSISNLLHNLNTIKSAITSNSLTKGSKVRIIAMVKANAYGHGIVNIAKILDNADIDAFGVASINEALLLRNDHNIKKPIILIEGVFEPDEYIIASNNNFYIVFHNQQQIDWFYQQKCLPKKIFAWIKIDTGMRRLGFSEDEAIEVVKCLSKHSHVQKPITIMSHFACANRPSDEMNIIQKEKFHDFIKDFPDCEKSFCNSAAIFAFKEEHYQWVRPGLALYGYSPFSDPFEVPLNLLPVMSFKTELIEVRDIRKGDRVGYDPQFVCENEGGMKVGIAAVGYGDGYPVSIKKGEAVVLINQKRCPIIGGVMMDMIAIDLSNCPDATVGTTVTLWGEELPIKDLVTSSHCSIYSLLTNIHDTRIEMIWE